jgi:hypothetical protein
MLYTQLPYVLFSSIEGLNNYNVSGISNVLENVKVYYSKVLFILERRGLMVGSRKPALSEFLLLFLG